VNSISLPSVPEVFRQAILADNEADRPKFRALPAELPAGWRYLDNAGNSHDVPVSAKLVISSPKSVYSGFVEDYLTANACYCTDDGLAVYWKTVDWRGRIKARWERG